MFVPCSSLAINSRLRNRHENHLFTFGFTVPPESRKGPNSRRMEVPGAEPQVRRGAWRHGGGGGDSEEELFHSFGVISKDDAARPRRGGQIGRPDDDDRGCPGAPS
uniref:Uncharacterized protein n=1 Tax=Steinernema glaseri TaxID=37863 RepID=A0A1I7ZT41_9BILA